jgi:hypothetical protein
MGNRSYKLSDQAKQFDGEQVGVREKLNEKPNLGIGVTVAIMVLAVACIGYEVHNIRDPAPAPPTVGYFTDDEGSTYFTAPVTSLPPFDHNGKQAVAAVVFKCKHGDPFVGYLQRFTDAGKKEFETPGPPGQAPDRSQVLVSAPHMGEKGWTPIFSGAATAIMHVKCPDGSSDIPEPVLP